MTSIASPCCTGSAERAHDEQGSAPSLSDLLRAIFCCGADKAENLEEHASGREGVAESLPEEDQSLSPEDARKLAEKMSGPIVVTVGEPIAATEDDV
jgi:hypothetical protein